MRKLAMKVPSALKLLILLLIFSPAAARAKDNWVSVRSENFTVMGNASESDMKKLAGQLEEFREAITILLPKTKLQNVSSTTVLLFKNDSSFHPFKPLYKGK